jgi:hypothetical protein
MSDTERTQNTEIVPIVQYKDLEENEQIEIGLEIIDESIRHNELQRLTEMEIVPIEKYYSGDLFPANVAEDVRNNIRLYKISEMVYKKGELATSKFTTVFNTLSAYRASVFIIIDSDGVNTDFYLGVRSNGDARSVTTLGDTLRNTLVGNFPGAKIAGQDNDAIISLSERITEQHNVASVSVVGDSKLGQNQTNEQFVQGLEKLALAMQGKQYTGLIVARSSSSEEVQMLRKNYQAIYTQLSPLQKEQTTNTESINESRNQSFAEMDGKQRAAMIAGAAVSVAGMATGAHFGAIGAMVGGQVAGQLGGLIHSIAPTKSIAEGQSSSLATTTENKAVSDMLAQIDEQLKRTKEFDSYGMWSIAGYFLSDDMSTAEIAASNYRSLMNGDNSGQQVSAINSWNSSDIDVPGNYSDLTAYLSRFVHPQFVYGGNAIINPGIAVSGKELGLHLGLPRSTVPGLPVIEHADFGKEVDVYRLVYKERSDNPKDRLTLGRVFDLGQVTKKIVELDNSSLNMHTFITGSTGSGKSNAVYQILNELRMDDIPFLVIEPAKGEYKDAFGNLPDVNVFSTNPNIAPLLNINPFKFPESIHVLEHIDGLVEIFSVCWPMYDAMPAFFKDAICKSYEAIGWDLGTSTFDREEVCYPSFTVLYEQLDRLIEDSSYHSDIKSNYKGALLTRVRSLTIGLNRFIFTEEQTLYENLFDQSCILDISRVKSTETKALLMGLMVYILNEYRADKKGGNNAELRHVTVLEEAHNLLRNTAGGSGSELVSKSVEILTNTIAEVRTYGEGFIIVDQSPSSVDVAAIKNTNTKIVLRTPEANDRNAVGRSMGLNDDQVNEIAKLPGGVAVVYQNDWISPVLTMIDKADVSESPFEYTQQTWIKPLREARTDIICMLMQPWIDRPQISAGELSVSLKTLELSRENRKIINILAGIYIGNGGKMIWAETSISLLQELIRDIVELSDREFSKIVTEGTPDTLKRFINDKTSGLSADDVEEICYVLTKAGENDGHKY